MRQKLKNIRMHGNARRKFRKLLVFLILKHAVLNVHAYARLLFVLANACGICLSPTWIYLAYRQELCCAKTVRLKSVNKTSLQEDQFCATAVRQTYAPYI
jgi:hypothetical protein